MVIFSCQVIVILGMKRQQQQLKKKKKSAAAMMMMVVFGDHLERKTPTFFELIGACRNVVCGCWAENENDKA